MLVFSRKATPTRNDVIEFGRRTRRNFEFIERAQHDNSDAPVHVVTQLTLSLLGIVIFPYERADELSSAIFAKTIAEIKADGWLGWSITLDSPSPKGTPTRTLKDLFSHIRIAAAHGRLTFNSDSASLCEVAITAEDKPQKKGAPINWRAEIDGSQLRNFCLRFLDFVNTVVS